MEQVIVGGYNNALSNAATEYNNLAGGYNWGSFGAMGDRYDQIVTTPGALSKLTVELSAAPGAGTSYTFTLMLNNVATALTTTIADANSTGQSAGSVNVVAGDRVCIQSTYAGAPGTPTARWSILFTGNTAKHSLILGRTGTDNGATVYSPLSQGREIDYATEAEVYQIIPTSGKIKNLYVSLSTDPGVAPDAYRFTLRVNGVSSTLTCTVVADDTTGNDTLHEVAVAAGDRVNLMMEPLNGPAAIPNMGFGMTFVADTDGESIILGSSSDTPSAAASEYHYLQCCFLSQAWTVTEGNHAQCGQVVTLKNLYVYLSVAPGAGKSYTIGVRVNGTTRLSVAIADANQTGSDLVNTWDVADYDNLNAISTPAGAPAASLVHWGLVGYIIPTGGGSIPYNVGAVAAAMR